MAARDSGTASLRAVRKRLDEAHAAHDKAVRKAAAAQKQVEKFARSLDAAEAALAQAQQRAAAPAANGASAGA